MRLLLVPSLWLSAYAFTWLLFVIVDSVLGFVRPYCQRTLYPAGAVFHARTTPTLTPLEKHWSRSCCCWPLNVIRLTFAVVWDWPLRATMRRAKNDEDGCTRLMTLSPQLAMVWTSLEKWHRPNKLQYQKTAAKERSAALSNCEKQSVFQKSKHIRASIFLRIWASYTDKTLKKRMMQTGVSMYAASSRKLNLDKYNSFKLTLMFYSTKKCVW